MIKSTTALCQPEQKLNSKPDAEVRNVSPACINTFVGGSYSNISIITSINLYARLWK